MPFQITPATCRVTLASPELQTSYGEQAIDTITIRGAKTTLYYYREGYEEDRTWMRGELVCGLGNGATFEVTVRVGDNRYHWS